MDTLRNARKPAGETGEQAITFIQLHEKFVRLRYQSPQSHPSPRTSLFQIAVQWQKPFAMQVMQVNVNMMPTWTYLFVVGMGNPTQDMATSA